MRGIVMFTIATITLGFMGLAALSWALEPRNVGKAVAPDPAVHPDAVVQVYGANVWGLRGRFAIHTWVVTKSPSAMQYRRYQVIGWRQRRGQSVVSITEGNPDGDWFGSEPVLLLDRRGSAAEHLIAAIHDAALAYPFGDDYAMWPGPNSNSFTAWIGLEVPELGLDLPVKAVGKDWMANSYPGIANSR